MTDKDANPAPNATGLKLTVLIGVLMLALGGAALAGSGKMRGNIFDRLDANNDNRVTADEIEPFTAKHFARFDGDGDGVVTPEEIDIQIRKRLQRRRAMLLDRFDADADGSITQAEFSAQAAKMFDRVDANDDGAISRAEAEETRNRMRARWHRLMHEAPEAKPEGSQEN